MSETTQILRDEHDNILRGLEILEACSQKLLDGQLVSPETMEGLIEFFRLYADRTHHGKEEELLFPAMIANGFSREVGPIHCMLADHDHNRVLTRAMIEATARYRSGDKKAGAAFASSATEYVRALREHIQKENLVLFVMADDAIPEKDQPALLEKFRDVDDNKIGAAEINRLLALRDSLSQQFLVEAR